MLERSSCDILILGSGGAGLFAALHAHQANPNLDIVVATKGLVGKSGCTRMVQGGYNVALHKGDSIERHFMDTIDGGKWLPNQQLAWTLVTKAIERVQELENEIGCFFDRNPDGTLHGKAFAGQTFDRTVHKGDLTGIEIINRLMEQVWARPAIRRLEEHRALALIPERGASSSRGERSHLTHPKPSLEREPSGHGPLPSPSTGEGPGLGVVHRPVDSAVDTPHPGPPPQGGREAPAAPTSRGRQTRGADPNPPPVAGVLFLDVRTGTFRLIEAKAVLLATGGGPTNYKYHTPSGDKSMDGLAMALRYGLSLRDMEMVQFHPTGVLAGPDTRMTGTIIEEGLRGAGGYLLDGAKQRFMFNYDPRGERATRDLVSQSMYREMQAGRTTPNGGLYIAMGHLGPEKVRKQFKGMVERCADCGFDLAGGLVEVVPTAHYLMGGVVVNVDTSTAATGLYCAGEDAGGVHGANRLGGNGVANSTVYGGIAGETMSADISHGLGRREPDMDLVKAEIARAQAPFHAPVAGGQAKARTTNHIRDSLLDLMWDDVGIIRDKSGMTRALGRLGELGHELITTGVPDGDRRFNLSWSDWLNLRSQIELSKVITHAALKRENSRGAHYREDFTDAGDLATSRFTVVRDIDGRLDVSDEAVQFTHVKPGDTLIRDEIKAAE